MLLEAVERLSGDIGQPFEFINMGGGLGIPYHPSETPLNIEEMAGAITNLFAKFQDRNGYTPRLYMESGRYITGAHGFSMGFNYNGRLRPKEILLGSDGTVALIRREERSEDYFAALNFESDTFIPARQINRAA